MYLPWGVGQEVPGERGQSWEGHSGQNLAVFCHLPASCCTAKLPWEHLVFFCWGLEAWRFPAGRV